MVSKESVRSWLVQKLSEYTGTPGDVIDDHTPFDTLGLASRDAVGLSGELSEWLGRPLAPSLFYDYSTVAALVAYVCGETDSAAGPRRAARNVAEPVAVLGLACRFPGADSPEAFWRLLLDREDAVTTVPAERWDAEALYDADPDAPGKTYARHGGFIPHIDSFDAGFFRISPREAARMDPQHRLLLELSWEALERSAIVPGDLAGSHTGVFAGICGSDYAQLLMNQGAGLDGYAGTGNAHSLAANRVAYALDLKGPSFSVDAACASSLLAIHLAAQSLNNGECDLALAGGVNAVLSAQSNIILSHGRMLSPDGRCAAFEKGADGYVRSEGCGVVVLKRLSDAEADGDPILAVLKGAAVNHDGRSNGLTAPNGAAQELAMRRALEVSAVSAEEIGFVEAQGTGTELGDTIEAIALNRVVGTACRGKSRCYLGAVKTNLGHLEGASGISAFIKTVIALHYGVVPPNRHLKEAIDALQSDENVLELPRTATPWPADRPYASVNAFGFGGANVHAVLAPYVRNSAGAESPETPWQLCPLSARTPDQLRAMAAATAAYVHHRPNVNLAQLCSASATRRTHWPHRLAVVASSPAELALSLESFCRDAHDDHLAVGEAKSQTMPPFNPWAEEVARSDQDWLVTLKSVASLYVRGVPIDWPRLDGAGYACLNLPTYPFARERHWLPAAAPPVDVIAEARLAERDIYDIVARILEVPREELLARKEEDFASLGLDSLALSELLARLGFSKEELADVRSLSTLDRALGATEDVSDEQEREHAFLGSGWDVGRL